MDDPLAVILVMWYVIGLIYPTVHYHKLILHGVFACQKSANMYAFNSPCVYCMS